MRVLWITGSYFPQVGGLQVYTDRLINSLAGCCEVGLLTEANQFAPANRSISHFGVADLTHPLSEDDWRRAAGEVAAAVREFEPDLVHFANASVAVYSDAVPAEIPIFATVHGNDLTAPWQWTPGQDVTACIVQSLNRCEQAMAVSNHAAELAVRWGVTAPVSVFTSGCDLEFFRPMPETAVETREQYGIFDDAPLIVTVGRLVPRKGHLLILEALRLLPFRVYWLIAGGGKERKNILAAIDRYDMGDRAGLLGEIPDEELLALYNACNIFVLTPEERQVGEHFDSEGFGLVFHEAGACGKPVITSDVSGCREAVFHGITGLVVPPQDPGALADSMRYILSDANVARSLGRGGLALVHTLGGWPRLASQIYDSYERAVMSKLDYRVSNS